MRVVFIALCVMIAATYSDDLCFLPKKEGFCRALIPRWYYNPKQGACNEFNYGGCYGNENNFLKNAECMAECQGFSCKTRYEAIGCFAHHQPPSREYQILNEHEKDSNVFGGLLIDWLRWSNYVPTFLCRCAEKAANNGFKTFAIHNLAECWGANNFTQEHMNKSSICWDRFYGQECKTATDMCVGGKQAHYYYKITTLQILK